MRDPNANRPLNMTRKGEHLLGTRFVCLFCCFSLFFFLSRFCLTCCALCPGRGVAAAWRALLRLFSDGHRMARGSRGQSTWSNKVPHG